MWNCVWIEIRKIIKPWQNKKDQTFFWDARFLNAADSNSKKDCEKRASKPGKIGFDEMYLEFLFWLCILHNVKTVYCYYVLIKQIVNSSRILPRKKKLNPHYTQTKSWYVLYGSSFSRFSQQGAIEYNQSITQPAIKLSIEKQLLHIATFWETFRLQTITTLLVRGVLYHKK